MPVESVEIPFPDLRFLKLKARQLQKGYAVDDPWALQKFKKHWRGPLPPARSRLPLASCYQLLANAFRCREWSRLKVGLELLAEIRNDECRELSDTDRDQLVFLLGTPWPTSAWARRFLKRDREAAHRAVIRGLKHQSARVREACSQYVDHEITSWDPATYEALAGAMADHSGRVRASVMHAMGCQRCKTDALQDGAVELFLEGMRDTSARVRRTALSGIGQFRHDPRVRGAYVEALHDPSPRVRSIAAWGLKLFVDEPVIARGLFERLSRETHPDVIHRIVCVLAGLARRRLRKQTLSELESQLGSAAEILRAPGQPELHFYPLERLLPGAHAGGVRRYWIRVIYRDASNDESVRARSVELLDEIRPLPTPERADAPA